jgi:hypothetical protein
MNLDAKPSDETILKNMIKHFESLIKDINKYGLDGRLNHDGPVLSRTNTPNGEWLARDCEHFIHVWRRRQKNPPTPLE